MSPLKDIAGFALAALFSVAAAGSFIAWLTVLPSIGLLWLTGALK